MYFQSLKSRIIFFYAVMGIVVLFSLSAILLYYHNNHIWEGFELKISSIAAGLSNDLQLDVMLKNKTGIDRMLKGASLIPDVVSITVFDNDAQILLQSQDELLVSSQYRKTIRSDILVESDILSEMHLEPSEVRGSEKVGSVEITFSTVKIRSNFRRMIIIAFSFAIIIILLSIVGGYFFITKITKPIEKLGVMTRAVARGDLTQRIDIKRRDEVGMLAASFNAMMKSLKERDDNIEEHKKQIEGNMLRLDRSLKEKELLLKEIHHRVKNNMQLISSMIRLQSKRTTDERELDTLADCRARIKTMALIHEKLYKSKDMGHINFNLYIKDLTKELFRFYAGGGRVVNFSVEAENVSLGIDTAIPCGLIINELVSNSLKYAFRDGEKGKIDVKLCRRDNEILELIVKDNGIGLPKDLNINETKSLGLKLVSTLISQLHGGMEVNRTEGAEFKIKFRELIYEGRA